MIESNLTGDAVEQCSDLDPPMPPCAGPDLAGDLSLVRGARVLVGLSGGPDSTALLLWLQEHGVEVVAAHFDHALRAGSQRDAEWVARLCRKRSVELVCERRQQPLPRGSLEAAARRARYAFLERARTRAGCDLVALGHTADDLVEGVLLHLLRGCGLAGMRGMPATRFPYVRPLLGVWRSQIEDYLRAQGVEALRDPSNQDLRLSARVRVRRLLLPALERDRPGIRRRLWAAARAAARLQEEVEAAAGRLIRDGRLCRAELSGVPAPVRFEAYRQLFGARAELPALSRSQLLAMDRLALGRSSGHSLDLPGGLRYRVDREWVFVTAPAEDAGTPATGRLPRLLVRPCPGCADPRAVHLRAGLTLTVGRRRPGLRMRPLRPGSARCVGSRKLQDLLTDAGIPRWERDRLPLVFAEGRLAWVPGIAVDAELVAGPGEPGLHVELARDPTPGRGAAEPALGGRSVPRQGWPGSGATIRITTQETDL